MTRAQQAPPSAPLSSYRSFTRDGITFELTREKGLTDPVAYVLRGYVFSESGKTLARGYAVSAPRISSRGWVNAEGCDAYAAQTRTLSAAVRRMTAHIRAQLALPELEARHTQAMRAEVGARSALYRAQRLGLPESQRRAAELVMPRRRAASVLREQVETARVDAGMCRRCGFRAAQRLGSICSDCAEDMAS